MLKVNRKEYSWGDVNLVMLGRPVLGLTGISYTTAKEKEERRGLGNSPLSIQHGNRSYSGTLTLKTSEIIALNRAAKQAGFKDLLDIETDIIVSYGNAADMPITVDKISLASFTEFPKEFNQGDLDATHALPFIALDIDYNTTGV